MPFFAASSCSSVVVLFFGCFFCLFVFYIIACGYGGTVGLLTLLGCCTGHKEIPDQTGDVLLSFLRQIAFF